MNRPAAVAILLVASIGPAHAADLTALPSRITAVTVYADRAQVTRTAPVSLTTTPSRFVVARLPGWIDAESVRVALDPPGAGQVLDVTVDTAYLAESTEGAVRKAQAVAADVGDQLAALSDEQRTLEDEVARLEALRGLSIDKVPRELAVGEVPIKSLGETMGYVTTTIRADRTQLRALAKSRRELEPMLAKRQRELSDLQARLQLQQSSVVVELRGSGSKAAQLRVTYLTPGAAWEPVGELRVSGGGTAVTVVQYASVTQTTGEDWTGAKLTFSTQNPGEVLGVPHAAGLVLDDSGAAFGHVVVRMSESFQRAQQIYTENNAYVARSRSEWSTSLRQQTEVQTRAIERFTQIASRGTTAHFAALSDRPVRADGKAVRVPIASGDFKATTKVVAVPELSLNAVRVANLVNGGSAPILPGRTMLYEDGAFIGRSELDFIAPGESFSLFLGVHDGVKLDRTLDRKSSALRRRGKRTELTLSFLVTAENLGATPITMDLSEQIPVAQNEEIKVRDVELAANIKTDSKGIAHWTATILPHTKTSWHVGYKLDYPSDFVMRSRANDNEAPATSFPSPAAPSMMKPRKMADQIDAFEKTL